MKTIYKNLFVLISFALLLALYTETMAQAPAPPEPGSTSSGQQIGGTGQIPSPPAPGTGIGSQQIGGSGEVPSPPSPGNGQQIGGSGNIPEPPAPGGGQQIGGNDTVPEPPDPGSGYPMGTAFQTLTIPAGWSGVSSQVVPYISSLDSIFQDDLQAQNLVILQNFSQVFWPAFNINTIGAWNTKDGYTIKVLNETEVELIGLKDQNDTVSFNSGWNYLPIISSCYVNTEQLFAELVGNNQLIIAYEIAGGGVYWPGQSINTMPVLMPGKAYFVKVTDACSVSFPECIPSESLMIPPAIQGSLSPWQLVAGTPIQQFLLIPDMLSSILRDGDYLGAFTSEGICAGVAEIKNTDENNVIVLFGDDPTTIEKDGFSDSEPISLTLYRPSTSEYFRLSFNIDNRNDANFCVRDLGEIQNLEKITDK